MMAVRAVRAMRAVKARLGWAGMSLVINFIRWVLVNGCRWLCCGGKRLVLVFCFKGGIPQMRY